jgi:hypothetical protein
MLDQLDRGYDMESKGDIDLSGLQVNVSEKERKAFMVKRMGRTKNSLARFLLNSYGEEGPDRLYKLMSAAKKQRRPYLHLAFLCQYFIDQFGEYGLTLLYNVLAEGALKEVDEVLEILKIEERDAIAAARILSYMHSCGGIKGEITEASPHRAVRTERFCPIKDELNREWGEKVISLPMIRLLARRVNPNIVVSHPKYLCGGDDRCELVFEMKK